MNLYLRVPHFLMDLCELGTEHLCELGTEHLCELGAEHPHIMPSCKYQVSQIQSSESQPYCSSGCKWNK